MAALIVSIAAIFFATLTHRHRVRQDFVDALKGRIDLLEAQIEELIEERRQLRVEVRLLREENSTLRQEVLTLRQRLNAMTGQPPNHLG